MVEVTVAEFATILDSLGEPVFVYGEALKDLLARLPRIIEMLHC
jgi:hypothetical protein